MGLDLKLHAQLGESVRFLVKNILTMSMWLQKQRWRCFLAMSSAYFFQAYYSSNEEVCFRFSATGDISQRKDTSWPFIRYQHTTKMPICQLTNSQQQSANA